jgi:hypothetical protein
MVLVISQVEVTDLQCHNLSQLQSNCMYLLREVRSDQAVVEVAWDTVMTNCASQRRDIVEQDRWDDLFIHRVITMLATFLSNNSARLTLRS